MNNKICPKCGSEHTKKGVFCTRRCANSRTFTEESRKKKSDANKKYWTSLTEEDKKLKGELIASYSPYNPKKYLQALLTQDWNALGLQSRRLRVILEQEGKCKKCGLSKWMGERITLEMDHIDGDKANNSRNNLEILCPNCHSQTKTWRGRKNKYRQKRVERLLDEQCLA